MPADAHRPTTADVDVGALRRNYAKIRQLLGLDVGVLAVLNGDAYGHGAVRCAHALEATGVAWLGIGMVGEGVSLRQAGISRPILVLSGIRGDEAALRCVDHHLVPVVSDLEAARSLNRAAQTRHQLLDVHLAADTGMGRLGVPSRDWPRVVEGIATLEHLRVQGVMSHFANAGDDPIFTATQHKRFARAVMLARSAGLNPELLHLDNSAGCLTRPEGRLDLVRAGILLYGVSPVPVADTLELEPVMRVRTEVHAVREVDEGEGVSYGHTWLAPRPSRLAVLPVGYADGYPRALSDKASVLIGGRRAPLRGRIGMDLTVVDITDLGIDVRPGDEVVLLGKQGQDTIPADELALLAGTIPYEIVCGFSRRVPRQQALPGP